MLVEFIERGEVYCLMGRIVVFFVDYYMVVLCYWFFVWNVFNYFKCFVVEEVFIYFFLLVDGYGCWSM